MNALFKNLAKGPMPEYDGWEPSELDLRRIRKYIDEDRFNDLSKNEQRFVTRRLLPSIFRYGCYPPPSENVTP